MIVLFSCAGVAIITTFFVARRNISQGLRFERMANEVSKAASRVLPRPAVD